MPRDYSFARLAAAVLIAGAVSTTCRDSQAPREQGVPRADVAPLPTVVLVGAGNIAWCSRTNDEATAALLDGIPGTVFALGDNVYPSGTIANYTDCYGPSWGRYKSRTYPALGNHEYDTSPTAADYFTYFGAAGGDPTKGYYSYDLGAWHIIVLNSNNAYVSTAAGSSQETWLKADLAATTKQCVLAMWHNPRFYSTTSSQFYPTSSVKPFWDDLYAAHATLIINAHMHDYERFAPQTPTGAADPVNGIREIIVGTGGGGLDQPNTLIIPNSEVLISGVYGVLKLTLADGAYSWQFIPVAGQTASDNGTATCYGTTPTVNHAPRAVAGGPYSGSEGSAVSFDGSGSSDPDGDALTYAWSFGDGSTGVGAKPSHSYGDNGTYSVTLTVTDAHGAASAAATTTATIANVASAVNAGANQTVTVGTSFALNASFSDPGLNDGPWAYTLAWGDGSPQTSGSATSQSSPITAAHTYTAAGTNTVRVTVTDKDGGVGSGQLTVTVTATPNHAPTAAPGGPYVGAEGTAIMFDGSRSSDPDGDALTYAWSFGDGTTGAGVKASHTYANNALYTVTLTVTDARGASSAAVTTTATIANAAPAVNAGANQAGTAGSALTVSASFSDPGVNDAPWSYAFDWGDGSPQTAGSTTSQATPVTATHTYQTAGSYSVRVTVTDRDGASGVGAKSITVSTAAATVTLVGAGTVASCSRSGDEATAAILDATPGTVFTLGDNVYPSGSLANYQNCYDPSWGRHKARTAPALGNHEYDTSPTAADYFTYFGAAAGDPTKGYYSYDLGAWHIVALNSNVSMSAGSTQEQWLRADLAAHPQRCTLAYWHHPRFSSGSTHGSMVGSQPLWQALYDAGAELVLSGHEHNYERFAPQTPGGTLDLARGIREFVVGTGGGSGAYPFGTPIANSEVRITGVNGVLKLTLGDGSYSWQFIPVAGQTATDSGSGTCH
jgi:PKD repeat protein